MCDGISIGGNVSIQISGGGPNVADIQSGLATAAAVAALATSVAGREQQISVNAPNHIAVTADMTSATWNTVATHKVFAITGAVRMRMWIQSHSLASGTSEAYMSLLIGNAFEVFRAGKIENTNGFWVGQNTYQPIIASGNVFQDYVLAENVGYGVTVEPLAGGYLIFHGVWEPLSDGATVVAGAGGPL